MAQRQFRSDDTSTWAEKMGDGSDGDYSSSGNATDAPIDSSCSGTATATSLTATNASFATGQLILIHQTRGTGAGQWELNKIAGYTAGTITTSYPLIYTYTDSGASQAQVLVLKQYSSFTQNSGHTLTAKAWNGNVGGIIAFVCNGDTTITGTLDNKGANGSGQTGGTSKAYFGGNGNYAIGAAARGNYGEGYSGASAASSNTNANGNGGGGGYVPNTSFAGAGGGGGGNGTAGSNGGTQNGTGGSGGATAGSADLTSMIPGGGGGGGAIMEGGNVNQRGGAGGAGGGIILIISKNITISGSIISNGGNGSVSTSNTDARGSGGGGAGGSILLKAQTATLGATKVSSSAGTGGVDGRANGGNGGVGRIHLDYSDSYTGTTTPTIDATLDTTIKPISSTGNFLAFM